MKDECNKMEEQIKSLTAKYEEIIDRIEKDARNDKKLIEEVWWNKKIDYSFFTG